MRPLQIVDKPSVTPFVCVMCGSGPTSREHFVDLGIDSEMHSHDQFQTHHITDGVIYLCNICMTSVISSYLQKLFEFVNAQRTGHELHAMQNAQGLTIQQNEITMLRGQLVAMEKQLAKKTQEVQELVRKDFSVDVIAEAQQEKTADEILSNLLGEKNESEITENTVVVETILNTGEVDAIGNSARESDDSNSPVSDSDTTGTDQSPDGNSPATQSLIASDLFDLRKGSLIRNT